MAGNFAEFGAESDPGRLAFADEQEYRGNELKQAQTLGQLSMLPAQQKLATAHARYYEAQAGKAEQEAAEARQLAEVAAMIRGGKAGGADPTDYIGQLSQMGGLLMERGLVTPAAKLFGLSTQMTQRAAQTEAAQASAGLRVAREQETLWRRLGAMAGAATDQRSWNLLRAQGLEQGLNFAELPENFEEAKPQLQALANASMTAAEQARRRAEGVAAEQRDAAQRTRVAQANATIARANAQIKLIEARRQNLEKNGEANGEAYRQLTRERTKYFRELRNAKQELVPIAPTDLSKLKPGMRYMSPSTGQIGRWTGEDFLTDDDEEDDDGED